MGKNISFYTFFVLIYVLLSAVSSYLTWWISPVLYILAFAIPLILSHLYSRRDKRAREEARGLSLSEPRLFRISGRDTVLLLPLIAPTVGVVFLVSYLTSLLLTSLGVGGAPVYTGGEIEVLLRGAVAPAILEELLFRYVPILLIAPYSRKYTVLLSAVYFAIVHTNPWQMPYAFLAGILFIIIDLSFSSVIPSLLLHLINNSVSFVWSFIISGESAAAVFVSVLVSLAALSLLVVGIRWRAYLALLRGAFCADGGSTEKLEFDLT